MYRVELKALNSLVYEIDQEAQKVPNVPCGVESLS